MNEDISIPALSAASFTSKLKDLLKKHLQANKMTVAAAILIACEAVEVYSREKEKLAAVDKRKWAQLLVPEVIDVCVHNGYVSADKGDKLKKQLAAMADVLQHVIDVYCLIANQPALLQLEETVRGCCGLSARK